jgi:hypothetical protein
MPVIFYYLHRIILTHQIHVPSMSHSKMDRIKPWQPSVSITGFVARMTSRHQRYCKPAGSFRYYGITVNIITIIIHAVCHLMWFVLIVPLLCLFTCALLFDVFYFMFLRCPCNWLYGCRANWLTIDGCFNNNNNYYYYYCCCCWSVLC